MSECELPQYYVCREPVARKEHGCVECSAKIKPGEKYLQVNACWEGRPCVERQHLLCAKACELIRDAGFNDDECLAYGELQEWWSGEVRHRWHPYHESEREKRRQLWRMILAINRRERLERREKMAA